MPQPPPSITSAVVKEPESSSNQLSSTPALATAGVYVGVCVCVCVCVRVCACVCVGGSLKTDAWIEEYCH
jgi:hypothetical protein